MFKIGDMVTRKSYNNDIIFMIIDINNDIAILKGIDIRLIADSNLEDLKICSKPLNSNEDWLNDIEEELDRSDFFYIPGKILHIDGDCDYLNKCIKLYNKYNVLAYGICIKESEMKDKIVEHLQTIKPDILVITGHDSFKKAGKVDDVNSYMNSSYFISAVQEARKYERAHDKLIIIAGACGSFYEALIRSGANFASSPKRINIHALDPAIVALKISLTDANKDINIRDIIDKTKYGKDGIGGIITHGTMFIGYPRT